MRLITKCQLTIVIIVSFLSIKENTLAQNKIYIKAFQYINNQNKNKAIITIDTIIHINLSEFYKEISLEWKKCPDVTIKILDSVDHSKDIGKLK